MSILYMIIISMAPLTAEKMYVNIMVLNSLYRKIYDIEIQITFLIYRVTLVCSTTNFPNEKQRLGMHLRRVQSG